jgi:hypothetical protein
MELSDILFTTGKYVSNVLSFSTFSSQLMLIKFSQLSGHNDPVGGYVGLGGHRHAFAALRPGKTRYSLHRRGVNFGADVDGYGKSRPHRISNPGPSSP